MIDLDSVRVLTDDGHTREKCESLPGRVAEIAWFLCDLTFDVAAEDMRGPLGGCWSISGHKFMIGGGALNVIFQVNPDNGKILGAYLSDARGAPAPMRPVSYAYARRVAREFDPERRRAIRERT